MLAVVEVIALLVTLCSGYYLGYRSVQSLLEQTERILKERITELELELERERQLNEPRRQQQLGGRQ